MGEYEKNWNQFKLKRNKTQNVVIALQDILFLGLTISMSHTLPRNMYILLLTCINCHCYDWFGSLFNIFLWNVAEQNKQLIYSHQVHATLRYRNIELNITNII